jgi:hypothetical protein
VEIDSDQTGLEGGAERESFRLAVLSCLRDLSLSAPPSKPV